MAMLNAPTMQCDRVNLRRSVPVQKRQQIFETVPVRHRGTLSDEVAPLPEQVEPHYSTVPFAHNVKGNIRKRGQGCPSPCRLARPWRYRRRGRSVRRASPVERRAIIVLGQDAFQAGFRHLDRGHRLVDQLADARAAWRWPEGATSAPPSAPRTHSRPDTTRRGSRQLRHPRRSRLMFILQTTYGM
jgi:hypothetical protein